MNTKAVVTIVLLIFIAASIIYLGVGGTVDEYAQSEVEPAQVAAENSHRVVTYYYHGNRRCVTCQKIEAYAAETVQTTYAEALEKGDLAWQVLNFEDSANADAAEEYNLVSQSLVVVEWKDGEKVRWKNLDQIWKLVGDKDAFQAYVRDEVSAYLGSI